MNTGPAGLALLKQFEGCKLTAYAATADERARGIWTIGWGTTGRDIHAGLVWTQAQCDARLVLDVDRFDNAIDDLVRGHPTTQHQFDAMVVLAYNIGAHGFAGSTVLRRHNAGDHHGAADAFLMWVKQSGVTLPGLTRRRQAERALYLS